MREAFLTGNIGKQPEMFTPEGSEWTCLTFSIANNEENRKVNEQYENITSWFDLEYWTKKPSDWMRKLVKGQKVTCQCKVKQQTWNDKDTNKQRSKIVFIVEKWPELGEKSEGHAPSSNPPQGNNSYNNANNNRNSQLNNQYPDSEFNGRPGYDYPDNIQY